MKKLIRLYYFLLLPVYWLAFFIPKNKRLWIFGAWNGEGRGDNSEAFFNYVRQYHPEIKAVWLTKSPTIYEHFKKQNATVYYRNGLPACWISARAKIAVINCYKYDVNRYFLNRTKIIQLWHGTPLKKIENDSRLLNVQRNRMLQKIKEWILPFTREKYHYLISASQETARRLASAFQRPLKNILVTGYPRNDVLFCRNKPPQAFTERIKSEYDYQHVFLYTPTFRDTDKASLAIFDTFDAEKMAAFLQSKRAVLIIKGHLLTNNAFINIAAKRPQIQVAREEDLPDVNQLLPEVDILITDYSSIYFDYLLLNRPIVFTPFDLETYVSKDRELYYEYHEVTPGPKAANWQDVMDWLDKFLQNPALYSAEREKIKKQFNQFCDGNSSERLFREIISILK
ncbi:MAG: CDP-glycerol glycerophosphotransferase family protein [bacterium]